MSIQPSKDAVIAALRTVQDPEIPVNLYDLGLIYAIEIEAPDRVTITMTLTTPNCPVAESMPGKVEEAVRGVEGVGDVTVSLVWEPAWSRERMSEDAALQLEMMGITWSDTQGGPRTTSLTFGTTNKGKKSK